MKSGRRRLWREPLLHFLLIGLALFLLYGWSSRTAEGPPKPDRRLEARTRIDGDTQTSSATNSRVPVTLTALKSETCCSQQSGEPAGESTV